MGWFKRTEKGIQTSTDEKKDTPKGLWYKSPTGKIVDAEELEEANETTWSIPDDLRQELDADKPY